MTRLQKMVGCICILSLVLAGLWWYWERPMPLNQLLPKEQWVRMQLEQMLLEKLTGDMAFAEPPLEDFLENLPSIRVNRAEKNPAVEDESFRITLYKGEAWPTVMYVSPSGRISIAADMKAAPISSPALPAAMLPRSRQRITTRSLFTATPASAKHIF